MIFSGSENRPRAGMASATVVFDNSDGWLPIDFSEVGITRRAIGMARTNTKWTACAIKDI
jgi:chromosome segregation ATPase